MIPRFSTGFLYFFLTKSRKVWSSGVRISFENRQSGFAVTVLYDQSCFRYPHSDGPCESQRRGHTGIVIIVVGTILCCVLYVPVDLPLMGRGFDPELWLRVVVVAKPLIAMSSGATTLARALARLEKDRFCFSFILEQGFGIRKSCSCIVAKEGHVPDSQKSHQNGDVLFHGSGPKVIVHRACSLETKRWIP